MRYTHRVLWEHFNGPIPDGAHAGHVVCDNGSGGCCNWLHVFPQLSHDNCLDGKGAGAQNARKEFCKCGSEYDYKKDASKARGYYRRCKNCQRAYQSTPACLAKERVRDRTRYALKRSLINYTAYWLDKEVV